MKEMPEAIHEDHLHKAWSVVLKDDRPIKHFFIPIGRAPDADFDLYVHYSPLIGTGQPWLGFLWANAEQLMTAFFPSREWRKGEIEQMSVALWGRHFGTTRDADNRAHDDPDPDINTPLFRASENDDTFRQERSGCGSLVPCDEYCLPRIIHYVDQNFGLVPRTRQAIAGELKRLEDINAQNLRDYVEMRGERDMLRAPINEVSKKLGRYQRIYVPLAILYVFCSVLAISLMAIFR